jgi:hypothetical protein
MIVVRFVEIVQKHVKDPAILAGIASDLESIEGIGTQRVELPPAIEAKVVSSPEPHGPGFHV